MRQNQSGIAPLVAIVLAGVVLLVGGGGYYVYNQQMGSINQVENTAELQQMRDEIAELGEDYAEAIAGGSGDDGGEGASQDAMSKLEEKLRERAEKAMSVDRCNLDLESLKEALRTSIEARELGLDELADELEQWTKDSLRDSAADASEHWNDTWVERFFRGEVDVGDAGEGGMRARGRESEPSIHDRASYGELALMLGMEDLFDEINRGEVEPSGEKDKNCEHGYTAKLRGSETIKMIAGDGTYKMMAELSTCDEHPMNAHWIGGWDWDWEVDFKEGGVGRDGAMGESEFTTQNGYAEFTIGDQPARASARTNSMTISFRMPNLETVEISGEILKGSSHCEDMEDKKRL